MMAFDPSRPVHAYVSNCWAVHDDREPCRPRYFLLMLYPDAAALQAAARRYRPDENADWAEVAGCFQPTDSRSRYDRRRREWIDTTPPFAGVMRLHRGALTAEVIAHECTHAAVHITRLHDWSKPGPGSSANLGDDGGPVEESFAYLLGRLTQTVTRIAGRYRRLARRP